MVYDFGHCQELLCIPLKQASFYLFQHLQSCKVKNFEQGRLRIIRYRAQIKGKGEKHLVNHQGKKDYYVATMGIKANNIKILTRNWKSLMETTLSWSRILHHTKQYHYNANSNTLQMLCSRCRNCSKNYIRLQQHTLYGQ